MAETAFRGTPVHTSGALPAVGSQAPDFELTGADLVPVALADVRGRRAVLNVFPSIDTGTCQASVRRFNELAAGLEDTAVVCVSRDLPFAQARFCGAEGIEDVITASDFRAPAGRGQGFGTAYGLALVDGPMRGLLARAVIVLDADGRVLHTQLVSEIADEPDYDAALAVL